MRSLTPYFTRSLRASGAAAAPSGAGPTRILRRRWLLPVLAVLPALIVGSQAAALTLDWDSNPWPSTDDRSETFSVGSGNVTVNISDPNAVLSAGGTGPPSVETNQHTTPTTDPGRPSSLFLKTQANTASPWVTIDILFTHVGGVTEVEFSIFDVDLQPLVSFFGFPISGYTDAIQVTGNAVGGGSIDPTSISAATGTPTWNAVGTNTVVGNAANAEESADGSAVFRFDQPIDSFSIQYRNDLAQGQLQWIGLSSIAFRRAPEPSTALLLGLGLAILARRPRR